ncbi:MAG: hypothetical protein ACRYFU_27115, partial [Janthinobacterium lividum]
MKARANSARREYRPYLLMLLLSCLLSAGAPAQTSSSNATPLSIQVPASQDGVVPTLHVYTNLIQVPTLVLSRERKPLKSLKASSFRLTLDSGPAFVPTYARLEGDDPISLAIFIDLTSPDSDLLLQVVDAVAALSPLSLRPQDKVSVYAMDCNLIRSTYALPADPDRLRRAAALAMQSWSERRSAASPTACRPSVPLWDSFASIIDDLSSQVGRRVLLAITNGQDSGSNTAWNQALRLAQSRSVAVFGVAPASQHTSGVRVHETYSGNVDSKAAEEIKVPSTERWMFTEPLGSENPFHMFCELSGGAELYAKTPNLGKTLERIMSMVRGRYILEFPRGDDVSAGLHSIVVSLYK